MVRAKTETARAVRAGSGLVDRLGDRFGRPAGQALADFPIDQLARLAVEVVAQQAEKRRVGDDGQRLEFAVGTRRVEMLRQLAGEILSLAFFRLGMFFVVALAVAV